MEKRMIVRPCYKYTVISFACMIIFIIICKQSVLSRYIPMLSYACLYICGIIAYICRGGCHVRRSICMATKKLYSNNKKGVCP